MLNAQATKKAWKPYPWGVRIKWGEATPRHPELPERRENQRTSQCWIAARVPFSVLVYYTFYPVILQQLAMFALTLTAELTGYVRCFTVVQLRSRN